MRQAIELDEQGRIVIPSAVQRRLGLSPGMTLVVGNEGEIYLRVEPESPTTLVDKQGVLVVRTKPLHDIADVTRRERDHRVFSVPVLCTRRLST